MCCICSVLCVTIINILFPTNGMERVKRGIKYFKDITLNITFQYFKNAPTTLGMACEGVEGERTLVINA